MSKDEKKAFWKRGWFLASTIMTLLMILLCILVLRDVELVEPPARLQYEYPSISDEDNIYVDLILALDDLEELREAWTEQDLSADKWETQEMQELLVESETSLASFVQSLRESII